MTAASQLDATPTSTVRMSAVAVVSLNTQMEVPELSLAKARSKRHTDQETYQAEREAKAAAVVAALDVSGGTDADASTYRPPAPPAAGWADPAQRTAMSSARRPPPLRRSASAEELLPPRPTSSGWRPSSPSASNMGKVPWWAAPQLGSCASSGHAWRLWAALHSQHERNRATGRPATASGARASRLLSRVPPSRATACVARLGAWATPRILDARLNRSDASGNTWRGRQCVPKSLTSPRVTI